MAIEAVSFALGAVIGSLAVSWAARRVIHSLERELECAQQEIADEFGMGGCGIDWGIVDGKGNRPDRGGSGVDLMSDVE